MSQEAQPLFPAEDNTTNTAEAGDTEGYKVYGVDPDVGFMTDQEKLRLQNLEGQMSRDQALKTVLGAARYRAHKAAEVREQLASSHSNAMEAIAKRRSDIDQQKHAEFLDLLGIDPKDSL